MSQACAQRLEDRTFFSAAGGLDTTFGNGGFATTDFSYPLAGGGTSEANAGGSSIRQSDGKVVVAGSTGQTLTLTRFRTDGTLDTSFGTGGTTNFPQPDPATIATSLWFPTSGSFFLQSRAASVAPDGAGGFYVGGVGPTTFALAHCFANGSWDANFGSGGRAPVARNGPPSMNAQDLVVDGNGRPVLVGSLSAGDGSVFAVARYLSDGQLDNSFGTGGMVTTPFFTSPSGSSQATALGVTVDSSNKLVVVGYALGSVSGRNFAVVRYNTDGTLDSGFGQGGKVETNFYPSGFPNGLPGDYFPYDGATAQAVVVDTSGRVVVAGADQNFLGNDDNNGSAFISSRFAMARYLSDGTLDSTFGAGGLVTTAPLVSGSETIPFLSGESQYGFGITFGGINSLAIDAAGRIVAGGDFAVNAPTGEQDVYFDAAYARTIALARYNANGSLDMTFGSSGVVNTNTSADFSDPMHIDGAEDFDLSSVLIGSDGGIMAVGNDSAEGGLFVAKYLSSAPVDVQTIGNDLQSTINNIQTANSSSVATFQATTTDQVSAFLTAISNLTVNTTTATVVNIALDAQNNTFTGQTVIVPPHVVLTINGATFQGHSPSLTLTSGTVVIANCTLTNSTNAPTILVQGGSLTMRDCTVLESHQYNQAAIEVDGGTVDLGTASDPGNNTITVRGSGSFLRNLTTTPVSAAGDTFLTDGVLADQNLQGLVWVDFNDDGFVDFGEQGIDGITVTLSGTDDLGNGVSLSTVTGNGGVYSFNHIRPGAYSITEGTVPSSYTTGKDAVGTLGGNNLVHSVFSSILVGVNQNGFAYNFGQQPAPGSVVARGQAAGIGFWANKNGQGLIAKLIGTDTSNDPRFSGLPKLSSWLAETMPNLFGSLAGTTPQQVAALFLQKFVLSDKLDAQVMATALNAYATNLTLAGTAAAYYGFSVSQYGLGDSTWNVGTDGAAFGVANNTTLTVMQILQDWDQQLNKSSTSLRKMALDTFGGINSKGGI